MGPATDFPMAGEAGRDWSSYLLSGLTDAYFPSAFKRTLDPDLVADRRGALLPAELAATAEAITSIQHVHSEDVCFS